MRTLPTAKSPRARRRRFSSLLVQSSRARWSGIAWKEQFLLQRWAKRMVMNLTSSAWKRRILITVFFHFKIQTAVGEPLGNQEEMVSSGDAHLPIHTEPRRFLSPMPPGDAWVYPCHPAQSTQRMEDDGGEHHSRARTSLHDAVPVPLSGSRQKHIPERSGRRHHVVEGMARFSRESTLQPLSTATTGENEVDRGERDGGRSGLGESPPSAGGPAREGGEECDGSVS